MSRTSRKFWLSLASCLCWSPSTLAKQYTVQEGDTLSQIAFCQISTKVYGLAGSLKEITKLNPGINDPDFIRPGRTIHLPEFDEEPIEREVSTSISTPTPEVIPTSAFQRFSFIKITPTISYARWDGVDPRDGTKASLISKTNVGVDISWNQVWSEKWRTFQSFGLNRWEISPDTSTQIPIQNSVQIAPHISMGAAYGLLTGLEIGGAFSYSQQLYYRGINGSQALVLDGLMVPMAELWATQRVLTLHPFDLVVGGKMISLLPASSALYNTSFGLGYEGKIEIGQTFEASRLSVGWVYSYQSQNSSILSLSRRQMGLEIGWTWRVGP